MIHLVFTCTWKLQVIMIYFGDLFFDWHGTECLTSCVFFLLFFLFFSSFLHKFLVYVIPKISSWQKTYIFHRLKKTFWFINWTLTIANSGSIDNKFFLFFFFFNLKRFCRKNKYCPSVIYFLNLSSILKNMIAVPFKEQ